MLKESTSWYNQVIFVFDNKVAEVFCSRVNIVIGLDNGTAQREGLPLSAGGQPVALRRCGRLRHRSVYLLPIVVCFREVRKIV